jgi:hypothetical protein
MIITNIFGITVEFPETFQISRNLLPEQEPVCFEDDCVVLCHTINDAA